MSGDFEDVCAERPGDSGFGTQAARRRCGLKVMVRQNPADVVFLRASQQRFEFAGRTQLDVDVFGTGKKPEEQVGSFFKRELSRSAFAWIPRGDDKGRAKSKNSFLEATRDRKKRIETKLEKIRKLFQCNRCVQIRGRRHDGYDLGCTCFDPFSRCHILVTSGISGERLTAPM